MKKKLYTPPPTPTVKGMSLRDYFAGQALALMAEPGYYPEAEKVAKYAYKVADAMLEERGLI